jgi:hypothetical protein
VSFYFHGTTAVKADNIEEEGLKTGKCGANFNASTGDGECHPVFLTVGKRRAAYWSQQDEITSPDGEQSPAIVRVNGQCLDDSMLKDDPRPARNRGDLEYAGDVPADCVTRVSPEEGKEDDCANAFEQVKDKEVDFRTDDSDENYRKFEDAVDKFERQCGADYRGGRFV